MKMILTLTKNEYKKLFGRISVSILLILLMLVVFAISMVRPYSYYDYYNDGYGYYYNLDYMKQNISGNIISQSKIDSAPNIETKAYYIVYNELYRKQLKILDLADELGIADGNDWRMQYISELVYGVEETYIYEYIKNGGEYAQYFTAYNTDVYYEALIAQQAIKLEAVKLNNYAESQRSNYEAAKATLETDRKNLAAAAAQKADDPDKVKDIDHIIFRLKGVVSCSESIVKAYEYLLENGYDYKSTETQTVFAANNAFTNARNIYFSFSSESEYSSSSGKYPGYTYENEYRNKDEYVEYEYPSYYSSDSMTYEEYYTTKMENIDTYESKGLVALYSLENEVTELSIANLARNKSLSFVHLFWFIAPLCIFFASGMVSKEFSTKTINLLLIRPVSRWKILLSKYLCLLSFVIGIIIAALGFYLLGSGMRLGFADFAQPYIYVADGVAHSISFLPWLFGRVLLASLPVICLISLTFMLSSVTKGTAVSLILGVLSLFSSILIFFIRVFDNVGSLTYVPFPYFSMWSYVNDKLVILSGSIESPFSYFMKADLLYGSLFLIAITVLSVFLAFADFTKKDIK